MYAKIFCSMYDGTLAADWKALVTFQQLLVLCDREGVIDLTARAVAARTGIPIEIIEAGIASLEQPDLDSRTPDREGRRIERLDDHRAWGWRIVNYLKYRQLFSAEQKREADRERIAAKRATERHPLRHVAEGSGQAQEVANVAQADADADADERKRAPRARARGAPEFHQQVIDLYHEMLPSLARVKLWDDKRRRSLDARIREHVARGVAADTLDWWRRVFGKAAASDFFCGRTRDPWKGSLVWLIERGTHLLKLIEGNYDNPETRRQ